MIFFLNNLQKKQNKSLYHTVRECSMQGLFVCHGGNCCCFYRSFDFCLNNTFIESFSGQKKTSNSLIVFNVKGQKIILHSYIYYVASSSESNRLFLNLFFHGNFPNYYLKRIKKSGKMQQEHQL